MHLDFETYSEADLNRVGLANYARHPSTRVLLAAWTDADGNAKQYDERDPHSNPLDELRADLLAADEIHAWNAGFEAEIVEHVLGVAVPEDRWVCSMGHAQYRSLPAALTEACAALGMEGKIHDAGRLIRLFCMPRKGGIQELPGDWERFRQYNADDIVLEAAVTTYLNELGLPWPEAERRVYTLSQRINRRGAPVDLERARIGEQAFRLLADEALARIAEVSGLANPNSPTQLRQWVSERLGRRVESVDAAAIKQLLTEQIPDDVREVLLLRAGAAMSAPKKYTVALQQAHGGRVRHMLQYSGAGRTHRWSGRGLQPQNLRRGLGSDDAIEAAWAVLESLDTGFIRSMYPGPFKLVADLVRSVIRPADGGWLAIADFSSIEVVMLYWAAGDAAKMKRFADGADPYKDFAAVQFGVPYEQVTKAQRTFAKPPVLGGGYGLGPDTLIEYAAGMGVTMTRDEAAAAIKAYRDSHPLVVALWEGLENAMRACIQTGRSYRYRVFTFDKRGDNVVCRLPAGTEITYFNCRLETVERTRKAPPGVEQGAWAADPANRYTVEAITYDGVDQRTGKWGPAHTWGGKITENIVQSISRDVLAWALQRAEALGLKVVLHVHDEIVVESRDRASVEQDFELLKSCMTAPPWCPDAPIRSAGFVAPAYRKD
jgi:DNA polymerase